MQSLLHPLEAEVIKIIQEYCVYILHPLPATFKFYSNFLLTQGHTSLYNIMLTYCCFIVPYSLCSSEYSSTSLVVQAVLLFDVSTRSEPSSRNSIHLETSSRKAECCPKLHYSANFMFLNVFYKFKHNQKKLFSTTS